MTSASQRLRGERGAELIEFALTLPLLLLVVVGIIDFGFLFQRMEVVTNAAREGARIAILPMYATADAQARACNFVQTGGVPITGACPTPTNPTITVTDVTVPIAGGATMPAKRVEVNYTHNYMFIGPFAAWFGGGGFTSVPLRGTAVMRRELAVGP